MTGKLFAISDLHLGHRGNEDLLDRIYTDNPADWLIVAGDIHERTDKIIDSLQILKSRFAKVIWAPGNHELYTTVKDPVQIFGQYRYEYLVDKCREIGVTTPEDDYLIWENFGQTVQLVPLFLLYDYTFLPFGENDSEVALKHAREKNVYATEEFLIKPDPFKSFPAWSESRINYSENRLNNLDSKLPKIFISHWPLIRRPVDLVWQEYFSLWCGTTRTADWHTKYNAICSVFGHLHIPHTSWVDGVRFEEVSVGYPRELKMRGFPEPFLRKILPVTFADLEKDNKEIFRTLPPKGSEQKIAEYKQKILARRLRNENIE